METSFRNNKLEKCYRFHVKAIQMWGADVGKRYILRINLIKQARDMNDLYAMKELKCHPLKGDRKGQFAISLTGFWRLIFSLQGERLEVVLVEEVSKHYDD